MSEKEVILFARLRGASRCGVISAEDLLYGLEQYIEHAHEDPEKRSLVAYLETLAEGSVEARTP